MTATEMLIKDFDGDLNNLTDIFPIHLAIQNHHANVVKLLIEHGFDIEQRDSIKWTALMRAAFTKGDFCGFY